RLAIGTPRVRMPTSASSSSPRLRSRISWAIRASDRLTRSASMTTGMNTSSRSLRSALKSWANRELYHRRARGSEHQTNLAEVTARLHNPERILNPIDRKFPVDHGMHLPVGHALDHGFELLAAPNRDADHLRVLAEQRRNEDVVRNPAEDANHHDR